MDESQPYDDPLFFFFNAMLLYLKAKVKNLYTYLKE